MTQMWTVVGKSCFRGYTAGGDRHVSLTLPTSKLEAMYVIRLQGHLPFTSSNRVEILGVNIQCWSLSKRKTEISQNVLVSIRKFTNKRKNALIKPAVYNL